MQQDIFSRLKKSQVLLADGATGTNLFAKGLEAGYPPELWNDERPEDIRSLYQSFVDSGSDLVLTNTFGGNSYRLKLHGSQDRVHELNVKGAQLAVEVAKSSDRDIVIAGSMGPTGEILQPVGALSHEEAVAAFREQAIALKEGGVDVFWFETISSLEEMRAGLEAVQDLGLPVAATMSFDTNGNTMMGISPKAYAEFANEYDFLKIIGMNCGVGAPDVVVGISEMKEAAKDKILVAKANCGIPQFVDGEIQYNGTPELMAKYTSMVRNAGASIIGGCCGTQPHHIHSMRHALDTDPFVEHKPTEDEVISALGPLSKSINDAPKESSRKGRRRR